MIEFLHTNFIKLSLSLILLCSCALFPPDDPLQHHFDKADKLREAGQLKESLREYDIILKKRKGDKDALEFSAEIKAEIKMKKALRKIKTGKDDPGKEYIEIGGVSGTDGSGCGLYGSKGEYAEAHLDLKKSAVEMGADYIQIHSIDRPKTEGKCYRNELVIDGVAFKKKNSK